MTNLTRMEKGEITKRFTVIGCPIEHSLSPVLHKKIFEFAGLNAAYSKECIKNDELTGFMQNFKSGVYDGINVTIPHKESIIPLLDKVNTRAKTIGAVNCVLRINKKLIGYNTDWYGFSMLLKLHNINPDGKSCLIIGAGGVSKAVLYALIQAGADKITVSNRTLANAVKLTDHFNRLEIQTQLEVKPFNPVVLNELSPDIIINCTSVGLSPNTQQSPIPNYPFQFRQKVIDTIYNPIKTRLIIDAENAGAAAANGLSMFIYQGLASVDIWLGKDASSVINVNELSAYLISNSEFK